MAKSDFFEAIGGCDPAKDRHVWPLSIDLDLPTVLVEMPCMCGAEKAMEPVNVADLDVINAGKVSA